MIQARASIVDPIESPAQRDTPSPVCLPEVGMRRLLLELASQGGLLLGTEEVKEAMRGAALVEGVTGDPSGVIGLPVAEVARLLAAEGLFPPTGAP